MAIPKSCVVICLSCLWLASSSLAHVVPDVELDSDDEWPVLCPPDTYYSREQELCLTCSRCPINNIITSPCHGLYDTKCGPFYDFHDVLSADEVSDADDNNEQNGGYDNFRTNNQLDSNKILDNLEPSTDVTRSKDGRPKSLQNSSDNLEFVDSEWKSLTIALIVLVSIFFLVVIVCVIYFLRRRTVNEKEINCEYSSPPENV